jgi:CBS domain-containing protein
MLAGGHMEGLSETIQRVANSSRPPSPEAAGGVPIAREIMTRQLITCEPQQPLREAVRLLLKHRISGLPVVDAQRRLVGMLSEGDCMRVLAAETFHRDTAAELAVSELMSTTLHWVGPDLDLFSIAERLSSGRLRRLPVLEDERLIGQISRSDVLRAVARM